MARGEAASGILTLLLLEPLGREVVHKVVHQDARRRGGDHGVDGSGARRLRAPQVASCRRPLGEPTRTRHVYSRTEGERGAKGPGRGWAAKAGQQAGWRRRRAQNRGPARVPWQPGRRPPVTQPSKTSRRSPCSPPLHHTAEGGRCHQMTHQDTCCRRAALDGGRGSAANAGPCRAASAEGVRAARMRKANTVMIDTVAPRVPSPLAAACAAESLAGFQLLGHKTSNCRTLPRGTCQSLRTTPLHANTTPEFSREHGKLHSVRGRRGGRARSAVREPKATAAQGSGWACVRVPYALACDTIPPLLPPHAYAPTRRRRICRHSALPMRPA